MSQEAEITEKKTAWTTWEELLLACAVKRHSLSDWDAVSMEIQSRTTSLPHIFTTPHHCKLKYFDLKRRFNRRLNDVEEDTVVTEDGDTVPWLDELRNLRVAELRHEVNRYDASILSLQTKVKRLEADCERNVADNEKPDLENVTKKDKSENDKNDSPESAVGKLLSDVESDRGNQSANESNSTGLNREIQNTGSDREREPESNEPDPIKNSKSAGEVGSCNESSDSIVKCLVSKKKKKPERDSSELRDSLSESKISVKSQPLIGVLELIRSHKRGSLFERRLENQENDRYNGLIRQHMDLQTMQKQLNQGSYSSCTSKFYRDLLLLFNNAIAFFPRSSVESITAIELRNLVSYEMSKQTQRSYSSPEPSISPPIQLQPKPESLLTKHKSSAHIIVCRKRSSISSKAAAAAVISSRKHELQSEEKKPATDSFPEQSLVTPDTKDRIVTGFRSLRRSNTIPPPKTEKTKNEKEIPVSTKKRGAADFLKRIKENYPLDKLKNSSNEPKNTRQNSGGDKRKHSIEKNDGRKDRIVLRPKQENKEEISPSKRNVGRPSKKAADTVPGKRRREAEVSTSKRPKKR